MTIQICTDDCQSPHACHDGTLNDYGDRGFDLFLGGVLLHFEREDDAISIAKAIAYNQGYTLVKNVAKSEEAKCFASL